MTPASPNDPISDEILAVLPGPVSGSSQDPKTRKFRLPRPEYIILFIGLACTLAGKINIIIRSHHDGWLSGLLQVGLPDFLFFTFIVLLIQGLYLLKPSPFIARCVLAIATFVSAWSILNLGWLIESGAQLQPGVLMILFRDPKEIWPLVQAHINLHLTNIILLVFVLFGICACLLWCFLRPGSVNKVRGYHAKRMTIAALIFLLLLMSFQFVNFRTRLGFTGDILGFSSHWYALVSIFKARPKNNNISIRSRQVPRVNQRNITLPFCPRQDLPNVIFVLLESISYHVTSMADPNLDATPHLDLLTQQGVEFQLTRVPVSQTNKAFWATLTSTTPDLQSDYIESIPTDTPYEGLPSILARVGYRSGFFQMAKGTFECEPGFFSNLAFDWAWFRENLQDPTAYLGYLAGDDCRMIEPALDWASNITQPFFLMMITSVAHDPYVVPEWFGSDQGQPYDNYIQAVRYTDYFLKKLCSALQEKGLYKNTLISIMGDHGTSFRTQIKTGRWYPYEEVIRIPWIIYWPDHIPPAKITWPCSQLDFTPTILNLLGFDITGAQFEGQDALTPLPYDRRLYFSSWYANSPIGFLQGSRKIVYWPYREKFFEYDLDKDPQELNPQKIALEESEVFKRDILNWQERSKIEIDARRFTQNFLYSHWQTFSQGRSAWAYYVP